VAHLRVQGKVSTRPVRDFEYGVSLTFWLVSLSASVAKPKSREKAQSKCQIADVLVGVARIDDKKSRAGYTSDEIDRKVQPLRCEGHEPASWPFLIGGTLVLTVATASVQL